nr:hypothetical protein [Tanacetum cinerariifolium]
MSTSNQQTLADLGANERRPMLEKGNYIPWESRFRRFLDNKLEEGDQIWRSIKKGTYVRPMISNLNNTTKQILKPLSKMTEGRKKQYITDVRFMNYLLQAITNDTYNSVDVSKEGESLESVYKRLTTLVNIMDHNNIRDVVSYDELYDSLVQFKRHVQASKAKKAAKNHDPLALLAHLNASSSQFHANYFYSPQPYYVTHPSSVVDYEDEDQGELQGNSQKDKLTTAMMLLAQAITQKFSTPTNNRHRTTSNIRNEAVIQDGRFDIQTKNAGYGENANRNARRQNKNQAFDVGNGNDESHYAHDYKKPRVRDANYFREQMLLAMKDEVGSNLKDEENDFMLDNSYGDETLEELTFAVIMMA